MKYLITIFFISSALLAQNSPVISKSGLEVDDLNNIDIEVYEMSEDGISLGLYREDVKSIAMMALRSNGIKPTISDGSARPYLLIDIHIVSNGFSVNVQFKRPVMYNLIDNTYVKYAITNDRGVTGMLGSQNKKALIKEALRDQIDQFCIDYYKANKNK